MKHDARREKTIGAVLVVVAIAAGGFALHAWLDEADERAPRAAG